LWENDIFIKEMSSSPYKVFIARDIDRYSVKRTGDGNKITLQIFKMGISNVDITDFNFNVDNGMYKQISNKYIYDQLIFPLTVKINYTTTNKLRTREINVVFEVTINEPGEWEIELNN
jgi:hypothetical protein